MTTAMNGDSEYEDEDEDEYLIEEEDEFEGRDEMGLEKKDVVKTEHEGMVSYVKILMVALPLIGLVFAVGTYFVMVKLVGQQELFDQKFEFIHEYQLGYVFLAVWITGYTRGFLVANANAARAPTRLDRPDQHVYKIMASSGPLKHAPYVMMANTGAAGRFNRAQRGVFNSDESLPLFLANTILAGSVFGPAILVVICLAAYGRATFAVCYKNSTKSRINGLLPAMIGEVWVSGLVLLCAVKGIFHTHIPF